MSRSRIFFPFGQGSKTTNNSSSNVFSFKNSQHSFGKISPFARGIHSGNNKDPQEKINFDENLPSLKNETNPSDVKGQINNHFLTSIFGLNFSNAFSNLFKSNIDPKKEQPTFTFRSFLKNSGGLTETFSKFLQKNNFTSGQKKILGSIEDDIKLLHKDFTSAKNEQQKLNARQTEVLEKILDNVKTLNLQTELSRQENSQARNRTRQERNEQFQKTEKQLEIAQESRREQTGELKEISKQQDEAGKSRLAMAVAYSSILSLIFGVLVFLYQSNQEKEKENQKKLADAEEAKAKADELAKKIEKIQLDYAGYINQKLAIEEGIKNLEASKANLIQMRDKLAEDKKRGKNNEPDVYLEINIKRFDAKIGQAKIKLQFVLSELKKLELYANQQQQQNLEETQKEQEEQKPETAETPKNNADEPQEPRDFRPF